LPQALRVAIERAGKAQQIMPEGVGLRLHAVGVARDDGARVLGRHREQRLARRVHRLQEVERALAQHDPPCRGQDVLAAAPRVHARRIGAHVGDEQRLVRQVVPGALRAAPVAIGDDLNKPLSDLHAERLRDDALLDDHHGRSLVEFVQHRERIGVRLRAGLGTGRGRNERSGDDRRQNGSLHRALRAQGWTGRI
jgi:hypothetical protein